MTSVAARRKAPKKKPISQAELKRQIAALKQENQRIAEELAMREQEAPPSGGHYNSPLNDRWAQALGQVEPGEPAWFLDGDEDENRGTLTVVIQPDESEWYQASCGSKAAYFNKLEDAAEQVEVWADPTPKPSRAINTPSVLRRTFETGDHDIGQDNPRELRSTGDSADALDPAEFEQIDRVYNKSKMDALAFAEQELLVMVSDTTNPDDVPIPVIYNGGRSQFFIRGETQTVKRKFVEQLARLKRTTYTQEEALDGKGNRIVKMIPHTALAFPFSVLSDPDPRGAEWLRNTLKEQ